MLKVGLTGNIACGKSFIGKLFKLYGVSIIDSDMIAREVVQAHSPTLEKIAQHFGSEILNPDGSLNRPLLRTIVFADKDKLATLNSIIHPTIHERTLALIEGCAQGQALDPSYVNFCASQERLKAASSSSNEEVLIQLSKVDKQYLINPAKPMPYIILDIPLLFENHLEHLVDTILVVDASVETQLSRIIARDHCSREVAQNIINKQLSREYKLQHANDIIQTDVLSMDEKREHVLNLHIKYLASSQDPRFACGQIAP